MKEQSRRHLRLVESPPLEGTKSSGQQLSFSFTEEPLLMVLVDLANASESMFKRALTYVGPDAVVDLRLAPRFDFGRINREIVFRMFEDISARYYDLPYQLGATDIHSAALNPVFVAEPIAKILEEPPCPCRVLILLNNSRVLEQSLQVFPQRLPLRENKGWKVRRFADL